MSISGFPAAPTKTDIFQLEQMQRHVEAQVGQLNQIIKEDIPAFNRALEQNKIKPLKAPEEVKF